MQIVSQQRRKILLAEAELLHNRDVAVPIINAEYGVRIKDAPLASTAEGDVDLIDVVGQLRTLVGSFNAVKEQLQVEARFLQSNYPNFSIEDVRIAFNLYMNNRLDIDTQPYVVFSPLFISHVMNAYIAYRFKVVVAVRQKAEPKLLAYADQVKNNSAEGKAKRVEGLKDCVRECYRHVKEGLRERFFFGITFYLLKQTKRLKIDDDLRRQAKEYAEKKYTTDMMENKKRLQEKDGSITHISETIYGNPAATCPNKEVAIIEYMKEFCLKDYFDHVNIDELINSITEKDLIG